MDTFNLTNDHLKLLKEMYVRWEDSMAGAPSIDCKRPYGNSSHLEDIAKILKWKLFKDENDETHFSAKQAVLAERLHKEMETALQICLCTQSFEMGTYYKTETYNDKSWSKID